MSLTGLGYKGTRQRPRRLVCKLWPQTPKYVVTGYIHSYLASGLWTRFCFSVWA